MRSSRSALIVVDPFNDFLSEGGKLWPYVSDTVTQGNIVENLKKLTEAARKNGILVIYAPHRNTEKLDYLNWKFLSPSHKGSKEIVLFERDSWGAQFHTDLQPKEGDLITQNHWTASGFANTDLDFLLKMQDRDQVIIAGMRANTCIDSTARYAVESGYHVTLIKDAIGAFNWDEINATITTSFPHYGHALMSTDEWIAKITE